MNSNELLIGEIKNQIDNLNKTYKDFSNNYKEQLSKLNDILEEIKNKQDNNNKLNEGEKYFYVSSYCETNDTAYNKDFFNDINRIKCGNWSHSRREIELRAKYISIYLKLQNFMRENDIKIDWNDKEYQYFINYDYYEYNEENSIFIDRNDCLVQSAFNFFTNTKEQCKKAIELYGDEIKEYFEELRCVDYGEYNNYDKEYTGN